jgi:hypothetical protein
MKLQQGIPVRSTTHKFKTESKEYRKETGTPLVAHTAKRARTKRVAQHWHLQGQAASSWSEPFAYSKKDTKEGRMAHIVAKLIAFLTFFSSSQLLTTIFSCLEAKVGTYNRYFWINVNS